LEIADCGLHRIFNPQSPIRNPKSRAFTLLELTLALAIAATIGLTVYAALASGFRARDVVNDQIELARESAVLLDVVERDFASVVTPASSTTSVGTMLNGPFVGYALSAGSTAEAHSVSFCVLEHDAKTDRDDVHRVELILTNTNGQVAFVRKVQRNLLATALPEPEAETLSRRVRAFNVRYYDGNGWVETWDSTQLEDRLPVAVSVTLELAPADVKRQSRRDDRPYTATRIIPIANGVPAAADTGGGG
jgi:type II secretion system protein J